MDNLIYLGSKAIYMVLALSFIPIIVATVVGLIVSLIQAVTHLQEQTLPFGVKLLVMCAVLYAMTGWLGTRVGAFATEVLTAALN